MRICLTVTLYANGKDNDGRNDNSSMRLQWDPQSLQQESRCRRCGGMSQRNDRVCRICGAWDWEWFVVIYSPHDGKTELPFRKIRENRSYSVDHRSSRGEQTENVFREPRNDAPLRCRLCGRSTPREEHDCLDGFCSEFCRQEHRWDCSLCPSWR
jgi:hypothetical protein